MDEETERGAEHSDREDEGPARTIRRQVKTAPRTGDVAPPPEREPDQEVDRGRGVDPERERRLEPVTDDADRSERAFAEPRSTVADDPDPAVGSSLPARPRRRGRGPITGSLAPYAGVLTVVCLLLVVAIIALVVVVIGARQPNIVASTDPQVVDSFDRSDADSLGDAPDLGPWEAIGAWGIVGGTAYLREPPSGDPRGFALLPGEHERVRIAATLRGLDGNGGLVARYQDPGDHLALYPVPTAGTWRISIVVDGEEVVSQDVGLVDTDDGARAELVVNDATAFALIDGQVRGRIPVDPAPDTGRAGVTASLEAGGSTRFDEVALETP
ncbi:hypothetical protein [Iamia sp.]|uniref:hypothetical protein n=1 Tax=Iamia sp. TaxID=2722710 RepID=UPI002C42F196|nr:hypothetical protein [Iamia sp.]HXH56154.1 hypothetical protein [Iamia sp.]